MTTTKSSLVFSLVLFLCCSVAASAQHHYYIPEQYSNPQTPETETLSQEKARRLQEHDWLFQAMGEPLLERSQKEIEWTRSLIQRLKAEHPRLDFKHEQMQLEVLEVALQHKIQQTRQGNPNSSKTQDIPHWIWLAGGDSSKNAPIGPAWFRKTFTLPENVDVEFAALSFAADDYAVAFVNGKEIGTSNGWNIIKSVDIQSFLQPGKNCIAIRGENRSPNTFPNPAGLLVDVQIGYSDPDAEFASMRFFSDDTWKSRYDVTDDWNQTEYDDSAWAHAALSAPLGKGPWQNVVLGPTSFVQYYAQSPAEHRAIYFDVRECKRNVLFENPVIDFSQLLFIDNPKPEGVGESDHESIHRMGHCATPGGRLLVLDGLSPAGTLRQLAPDTPGSFWRPDLSYDAQKVLFCYKPYNEKSFSLYEINLDGTGLRRLTQSEYDDIDPLYLPDGKIIFTTTRGNSYVRCGPFIYSYILARCDADGSNVYLISYNGEPDFVPALLHDGRIVYSRWEYSDKPLWRVQSLWTTNQDGTNTSTFWGNQSVWPDHPAQPRPIPGSDRIMFCGVGHHDWWSGSIGMIDPKQGANFPHGLTKVTADLRWPECSSPPVDPPESAQYHVSGHFTGYSSPYPLSEKDFLVSGRRDDGKFRLYLMDTDGNRDLIYEGAYNVLHAMPIKPRFVPAQHVDRVEWPKIGSDRSDQKGGTFYNTDVYQGAEGIERGSAAFLRVLQLDYKTYSTWTKTFRHSGPAVSIVQEEGVKRVLSIVPIEKDGSVHFEAPSGVALYFQLLDDQYRAIHTMRSFAGLMPGEQRGCIGCHEQQHTIASTTSTNLLALKRSATPLTPPSWGTESIGYERFVQPVLDKYCGKCHQGNGEARGTLDLTLRPGVDVFKEPYLTLVGSAGWGNPIAHPDQPGYGFADVMPVETMDPTMNNPMALETLPPYQYLSSRSRLVERMASGKHHDVKVDTESLRRVMTWVDATGPFCGEDEIRQIDDPNFAGIELLPIRPKVKTAPVVIRP
ncbi:MAG: hypothetical protein LBI05_01685 [Planctomycetaceae bacterium]|nr:hypothetical protein [Planctomycetaceae bacterium]